jgi:nitrite reductase/ring-hydroxylating ferredoxin subunit/uncharacterized membrane protein
MAEENDGIAAALSTQQWMEPVENGLTKGLQTVFKADTDRGKPVANALHGVWLGHPLHPMLTDIPIGAWTVAVLLDLVDEIGGSQKYQAGADAALTIGIAGAGAAAVAGLTDWKDIDQGARRTGFVHAMLNTVALSLFACSAVQRNRRERPLARALGYAGLAVTMASGWLGGHLTFAQKIGVEHVPAQQPPDSFQPVLAANELEESKPRRVESLGYPILLVKRGDAIFAVTEMCPHAGGPLSEGALEGDCIRCPWHGSLFSLRTGDVVEGPSVYCVQKFDTRVQNGNIEVKAVGSRS